jgi:hypothetical protein
VFYLFKNMRNGTWQMKPPAAIISAMCLMGLLSFSDIGEANEGRGATSSSREGAIDKVDPSAMKSDVLGHEAALSPESLTPSKVFRDIPSISGDYSVRGTRIMPYIGAGFTHGYSSDVDRSLNGSSSIQTDSGLRSLFGQGLAPSEVQMGIRIPF